MNKDKHDIVIEKENTTEENTYIEKEDLTKIAIDKDNQDKMDIEEEDKTKVDMENKKSMDIGKTGNTDNHVDNTANMDIEKVDKTAVDMDNKDSMDTEEGYETEMDKAWKEKVAEFNMKRASE